MNKISIPWHKVFVDVFILVFLCALFFIFKYQLDTHKSGFFCNDFSVNMVFKNSTVPNILLFVISFVLPSLFIMGTEICRGVYVKIKPAGARHNRHSTNVSNKYHLQLTSTREVVLSEPVGNIIINFMYFSLGHLCNSIVTLIGKKTIGRLRPNFLDVCKPEKNPYMTYCNTQLTGKTYLLPDIDFKCLTSDINPKEVEESRKSFPSGHSSSSFYAMIFLCIYVHRVYSKPSLGFLPHLLQTVFIATAVFIALSRIIDNKHHPTDVLAGSVLGVTIGLITSYYLNLFFRRFGYRPKYGLLTSSVATDYEMRADLDPETATNKTIVAANPDTNNTNSTTDGVANSPDNRNF